ncbi:MAG: MATE family efflux transporter [Oscillospiraceae bacterium]|nr:MATE family efflux transporter [Oscillospiraceae bacterium]
MIEKKKLYRDLFVIVLPIAFQNLMTSLVSASDAFMLGFLDQDALSASSLAGQVAFVHCLFYNAFVYGCNVLAAQYWGKKDLRTVEQVLAITMRYSLLVGLVFTVLTGFLPVQIMKIFSAEEMIIAEGAKYLRTVSLSYVLTGFSQAYFGIMKICDRAKLSSLIGSFAVILNIILNYYFIFIAEMGISGAALATVLAKIFEVLFILVIMFQKKCPVFRLSELVSVKNSGFEILHQDYWKYTTPLLFNQLGWGCGVTMYSVIMGHLGSDATAANSIASIVRSMTASLCWGIAGGVAIIIGGMLGRNELEQAKKAGGSFVRFSIWIGIASGFVILALTPLVLYLMNLSPQAEIYLKYMLYMASYYIIGNSLNSTVITGVFAAGGDTKFGMICDIITLWGFVVPLGMIGAFVLDLPVIAVAFILTLDEFVKLPAVYKHYMKYRWVVNLTKNELEKC